MNNNLITLGIVPSIAEMQVKDYYNILGLEPSASITEVKKAYRKLALQFHPDKNYNDPLANAQFAEIKEAYEVLTNPSRKEKYLEQRWYNQSMGNKKTQDIITPYTILKQTIALEKQVAKLDVYRMDKTGLQEYVLTMLSDETIEKLLAFNDTATNRQIVSILLQAIKPLKPDQLSVLLIQLKKLSNADILADQAIERFQQAHSKSSKKEKYTVPFSILITVIICLLIYLVSR